VGFPVSLLYEGPLLLGFLLHETIVESVPVLVLPVKVIFFHQGRQWRWSARHLDRNWGANQNQQNVQKSRGGGGEGSDTYIEELGVRLPRLLDEALEAAIVARRVSNHRTLAARIKRRMVEKD
jgi:hypothetical protein